MNFRETLLIGLRGMRAAPLRTVLTTVGLAVGVAAVIFLVALGNGVKTGFSNSLATFSTSVFVFPAGISVPGGNGARLLRDRDAAALADPSLAPDVVATSPQVQGSSVVRYGTQQFSARVAASNENYLLIFNQRLSSGRLFTAQENEERQKVVLLGPSLVRFLFDGDDEKALGSDVFIGRSSFRVVGLIAPTPDSDDVVVIPLDTARSSIYANNDKLSQVGLKAADPTRVPAVVAEAKAIMDRQHFIRDPGVRDFTVGATLTQVQKTNDFVNLLTLFTLGVASVALFVGGLGVANIMLVTVTERTHDIGIMKAIGARRRVIVKQFLIESVVLAGTGGVLGVGVGVLLTLLGAEFLPRYLPDLGSPELSVTAAAVAFGVSLLIGVFAGVYPAYRGASMRPVDALRY